MKRWENLASSIFDLLSQIQYEFVMITSTVYKNGLHLTLVFTHSCLLLGR
jgi:hypothetical protein